MSRTCGRSAGSGTAATTPMTCPDVTLVNWPQVDYWLTPLVGVTTEAERTSLAGEGAGVVALLRALAADRCTAP